MNNLLDSDRERETGKIMDKAISDALDPFYGVRRLLPAAMDAGRKALADDALPDVEQEEPDDATTRH